MASSRVVCLSDWMRCAGVEWTDLPKIAAHRRSQCSTPGHEVHTSASQPTSVSHRARSTHGRQTHLAGSIIAACNKLIPTLVECTVCQRQDVRPQNLEQIERSVLVALQLLYQLVDQSSQLGLPILRDQRLLKDNLRDAYEQKMHGKHQMTGHHHAWCWRGVGR